MARSASGHFWPRSWWLGATGHSVAQALAFASACLLLACDAAAPPTGPATPGALPCSQAHREIARWQGTEATECGPDLSSLIELTPLGEGRLLFRRRFTEPDELWRMRADGSFEPEGVKVFPPEGETIDPSVAGLTLVPAAPAGARTPQVLLYDPRLPQWRLYNLVDPAGAADPMKDPAPDAHRLFVSPLRGEWPAGYWKSPFVQPWGHQFLGLEDGYLLDVEPGDGRFRLWRFGSGEGAAAPLQGPNDLLGGPRPDFRRGHRLVHLGPGRLLEWAPRPCARAAGEPAARCLGADYHVWSYSLAPGQTPRDPFDPAPVSSGFWPQIGAAHDIVAADADHLVVWSRATGQLRSYGLEPQAIGAAAPDPLARPVLATLVDPRLQSLDWAPPTAAPELRKIVIIVQDGRSFDSYFGRYCQGAPGPDGAHPACDTGPSCCEAMPVSIPGAPACRTLDPETDAHRPSDAAACMRAKMREGAMDGFATATLPPPAGPCGDAADFACAGAGAEAGAVAAYYARARQGALADRFFQSYVFADGDIAAAYPGAYEQNFLYLVTARFSPNFLLLFDRPVLTKELARVHVPWAVYAGDAGLAQLALFGLPLFYDPTWSPYRSLVGEFEQDLATGLLPSVSIVLPDRDDLERSEAAGHPFGNGIRFVERIVDAVAASPAANDTLVLLAYASAGGYFDHVRPPPAPPLDVDATGGDSAGPGHPLAYGPRVPLLALGRFARRDHVSHVPLEMSSLAVFIEWNWLYGHRLKTARTADDPRRYRDTTANNLGSLLDVAQTVVAVPAGHE